MKKVTFVCTLLLGVLWSFSQRPVSVLRVDVSKDIGDMKPYWAFFGYDEADYTLRANGKKLLLELKNLSPVPVYIRTHNLLTSKGNSTGADLKWSYTDAYTENAKGDPVYNWLKTDSIIDTYIQQGLKPLMEIGFMPEALSSHPQPYVHHWSQGGKLWTGWTYPPKDYDRWRQLVYKWAKHSVERYGKKEVTGWLWEVWNEPDIAYWSGTFDEYCKLYDYAAAGLKQACPECTIGGPHTTGPGNDNAYTFLTKFIGHCLYGTNYATGKTGTSLQYIGFHAKGAPELINGHIRMNMNAQLKDIEKGFEAVNAFPELKNIPVIIGECDPEGCAACSAVKEPKYGYRNGTMYSGYTAAVFARIYELADKYKINLRGAVSWSFEFEDQPWFAGFRELATNGVDKPVLNVFRMLGRMGGKRIQVTSRDSIGENDKVPDGANVKNDVNAIACKNDHSISVLVWNYQGDDTTGDAAGIMLTVAGIDGKEAMIHHYRVDDKHSNSFERWKAMGKPPIVTAEQYAELEQSGQLQQYGLPENKRVNNREINLKFDLPVQGVSLIQLTW